MEMSHGKSISCHALIARDLQFIWSGNCPVLATITRIQSEERLGHNKSKINGQDKSIRTRMIQGFSAS